MFKREGIDPVKIALVLAYLTMLAENTPFTMDTSPGWAFTIGDCFLLFLGKVRRTRCGAGASMLWQIVTLVDMT